MNGHEILLNILDEIEQELPSILDSNAGEEELSTTDYEITQRLFKSLGYRLGKTIRRDGENTYCTNNTSRENIKFISKLPNTSILVDNEFSGNTTYLVTIDASEIVIHSAAYHDDGYEVSIQLDVDSINSDSAEIDETLSFLQCTDYENGESGPDIDGLNSLFERMVEADSTGSDTPDSYLTDTDSNNPQHSIDPILRDMDSSILLGITPDSINELGNKLLTNKAFIIDLAFMLKGTGFGIYAPAFLELYREHFGDTPLNMLDLSSSLYAIVSSSETLSRAIHGDTMAVDSSVGDDDGFSGSVDGFDDDFDDAEGGNRDAEGGNRGAEGGNRDAEGGNSDAILGGETTPDSVGEAPDFIGETDDSVSETPDSVAETPDSTGETPDSVDETADSVGEAIKHDPPSEQIPDDSDDEHEDADTLDNVFETDNTDSTENETTDVLNFIDAVESGTGVSDSEIESLFGGGDTDSGEVDTADSGESDTADSDESNTATDTADTIFGDTPAVNDIPEDAESDADALIENASTEDAPSSKCFFTTLSKWSNASGEILNDSFIHAIQSISIDIPDSEQRVFFPSENASPIEQLKTLLHTIMMGGEIEYNSRYAGKNSGDNNSFIVEICNNIKEQFSDKITASNGDNVLQIPMVSTRISIDPDEPFGDALNMLATSLFAYDMDSPLLRSIKIYVQLSDTVTHEFLESNDIFTLVSDEDIDNLYEKARTPVSTSKVPSSDDERRIIMTATMVISELPSGVSSLVLGSIFNNADKLDLIAITHNPPAVPGDGPRNTAIKISIMEDISFVKIIRLILERTDANIEALSEQIGTYSNGNLVKLFSSNEDEVYSKHSSIKVSDTDYFVSLNDAYIDRLLNICSLCSKAGVPNTRFRVSAECSMSVISQYRKVLNSSTPLTEYSIQRFLNRMERFGKYQPLDNNPDADNKDSE